MISPHYHIQEEPLELGLDGVDKRAIQQVRRHRQVVLNLAQNEHPSRTVASELIKRLLGELMLSPKGDPYSLKLCAFALFSKNACPLL